MPNSIYIISVRGKDMAGAADMLRYDRAFNVAYDKVKDRYIIASLQFTPARWASFNTDAVQIDRPQVTVKELNDYTTTADGFLIGVRAAQQIMGKRAEKHGQQGFSPIVEDYQGGLNNIHPFGSAAMSRIAYV